MRVNKGMAGIDGGDDDPVGFHRDRGNGNPIRKEEQKCCATEEDEDGRPKDRYRDEAGKSRPKQLRCVGGKEKSDSCGSRDAGKRYRTPRPSLHLRHEA